MRILVLLIISFFSFSQEEQYRSEFAWCNLKDGNSIDDAKNIAGKYEVIAIKPVNFSELVISSINQIMLISYIDLPIDPINGAPHKNAVKF